MPSFSVVQEPRFRTFDDEMVELGRSIEGFAGMHFDPTSNQVVVRLTASDAAGTLSQRVETARPILDNYLSSKSRSDLVGRYNSAAANFSFEQLKNWYAILLSRLSGEAVRTGDIDEVKNHIFIGVVRIDQIEMVQRAAASLGIPTAALSVEVVRSRNVNVGLRDVRSPRIGGLQVAFLDDIELVCTLGANVRRIVSPPNTHDGNRYFVTNAHCAPDGIFGAGWGSVTGFSMGQPNLTNIIASEHTDPPTFTHATDLGCPPTRNCRYSDAALFMYNSAASQDYGFVALTNGANPPFYTNNPVILAWHQFTNHAALLVGETIVKTGRTSGTTQGVVVRNCTLEMQEHEGQDTGRSLLCQTEANYFATGGDSGSAVYYQASLIPLTFWFLGLHWGHDEANAVFSPAQNISFDIMGNVYLNGPYLRFGTVY